MNFDRNSVIGFILLGLLFFGYFYFTRQGQIELEVKQKRAQDSIAKLQPKINVQDNLLDSLRADSISRQSLAGQFSNAAFGKEEITILENKVTRIGFSNKGGQPKFIELKKYPSRDSGQWVRLAGSAFDRFSYKINTGNNTAGESAELFFVPSSIRNEADGSQSLSYVLADNEGRKVTHQYTLHKDDYLLDWNLELQRPDLLIGKNSLDISWQVRARQQEKDVIAEKRESQIDLSNSEGFDYFTISDGLNKKFEEGVKWLGVKQKFFNHTFIAKQGFSFAEVSAVVPPDTTGLVTDVISTFRINIPSGTSVNIPFNLYYGPNDFKVLKQYGNNMEDMVNLGQGFYAFVKYINRWIVMPVFNLFSGFFTSYGLVIALLTIIIRLFTSPLVYTSYLSGAKMKALKPELDQLKEKYKDDQQAFSMEQMKLFRTAGVNPLGGCIPALLQIPIFFALYSFFNSEIDLRGQSFWWAKDLASYDSIFTWGFSIPFIGSHISLFTLLAVITSLLISLYSMSMTPDQNNPMLKYMPYIFPVMLLGIFNGLPAALTWYYTVSNVITLAMQYVIQNFIIDHDKIIAQLEENKKKPKSKPKWQERLEQMQESQKKLEDLKKKSQKK